MSKAERRSQIIEIASKVYASAGYEEVGIKDVAQRAGISHGLIYHYFPSKEALFAAAMRASFVPLLATLKQLHIRVPTPQDALLGMRAYLDYVEGNSQGYLNVFRGPASTVPEVRAVAEEMRQSVLNLVLAPYAIDGGDGEPLELPATQLLSSGGIALVEHCVLRWLDTRDVPREELLRSLVILISATVHQGLSTDLPAGHPLLTELEAMVREGLPQTS